MKISSHILKMTLAASLFASSAAVLAQDPTPTLPVKATPVPAVVTEEAPAEATLEATADAPLNDISQFEQTPVGDLAYNTPVIGRIDSTTPEQVWPLPVTSLDRIQIVVERLDGNLIPDVALLGSADAEIDLSYGATPDDASAIIDDVRIEAAGTLSVRVGREDGVDGLTEGFYQLTVIPLSVGADAAANNEIIGSIAAGETVTGTIAPEHWLHRYTYTAEAPDRIRVTVERAGGTIQPHVEILDSNGSVLSTGYVSNTGDYATADRVDLPSAGEYTIVVSRYRGIDGGTNGDYTLSVDMMGSGEGSSNLAGVAGELVYDEPVTGEITPERWYQDWTLVADAADRFSVTVVSDYAAGNLQPEIVVLGGSGQEVARGYTTNEGNVAVIQKRLLDSAGTYTVRVTRSQGQRGETSGAYNLLLTLDAAGEDSPLLEGATGEIALGEQVAGEVTNARWADTWTIAATADQSVDIKVERTGGTLVPMIEIRDMNGQSLRTGYYEATRDRAVLQYTFQTTGEYQIVILRDGEIYGETDGNYTLSVNATGQ